MHYLIAFKNPRDQTGIRNVLTQAFPADWRDKLDLFQRVSSRPFGYLMLDLHPGSNDQFRFWSHLTRQEGTPQVHTEATSVGTSYTLRARQRRRRQKGGQAGRLAHSIKDGSRLIL